MKKILFVLLGIGLLTGCSNLLDKDNDFCNDCVFGKSDTHIGKEIPDDYSSDYSKLGNYFLGHIVENGIVKKSYVCGIEQGKKFCLQGVSNSTSESKTVYDSNKKIFDKIYSDYKRDDFLEAINGKGTDVSAMMDDHYWVYLEDDSYNGCTISNSGHSFCR